MLCSTFYWFCMLKQHKLSLNPFSGSHILYYDWESNIFSSSKLCHLINLCNFEFMCRIHMLQRQMFLAFLFLFKTTREHVIQFSQERLNLDEDGDELSIKCLSMLRI